MARLELTDADIREMTIDEMVDWNALETSCLPNNPISDERLQQILEERRNERDEMMRPCAPTEYRDGRAPGAMILLPHRTVVLWRGPHWTGQPRPSDASGGVR